MKRWYSADYYRRRVERYRAFVPGGALFSDMITGFPGETDAEHRDSVRFVESLDFDGLHIFRYSARPGTSAASLKAPDSGAVRARSDEWHALDSARRAAHAARAVGAERVIAPELSGRDGLTEDFLTLSLAAPAARGLLRVRVTGADGPRIRAAAL
jgi:threonylcarbamoyladenosine tRNA methylthiotransferase MtaB